MESSKTDASIIPENFKCGTDEETKKDWKASWIWKSAHIIRNSFAYFRKEVEMEGEPCHARIFVSAHNHFKLYVNGNNVGGFVTPAPSHPQKSKYYLIYDIKGMLKKGKNVLGAIVHYIGGDGQNYVNGCPGFILQFETLDESGRESVVCVTDESWKVLKDTPYTDGASFQQNRRISSVESYDAAAEPIGWLNENYDAAGWDYAVCSQAEQDGWQLTRQKIPEGKIDGIVTPDAVGLQEPGLQVFDAGKIISGWPRLELRGIKGTTVRMRYSENIDEYGRVGHNVANESSETYYDEYRMRGDEMESWSPDFSYKAFRYIEVTGYPEIIAPGQIKAVSAHTDIEYKGSFSSSNRIFNDIYEACIATQKNNMLGQLVDCPHREQAQYIADSDMQAETLCYNFSAKSILEKVLSDFRDCQLEDGTFPFVFPSNFENSDFNIRIPEWDLHYCTLMWKIYRNYGDINTLREYYGPAKRMLEYYLGLIDGNTGLVLKCPDRWHISDWPYPNIDQQGRCLTVQNCKIYNAMKIMAEIALLLGLEEDSSFYGIRARELENSIVKHLYEPDNKFFFDCLESGGSHQGTNVIAYQYGLVPEKDRGVLLQRIVSEGMECKTLLSLNLFQVLFENGQGEHAYSMLNSTRYPGWGYMMSRGAKTIWEGFDDIESHCHAWNAYPARLLQEYILGVKPSSPGFGEICIKPFFARDMDFAQGNVYTIRGNVFVGWEKDSCGIKMNIDIPGTTPARIVIPSEFCGKTSIYTGSSVKDEKLLWKNGSYAGNRHFNLQIFTEG